MTSPDAVTTPAQKAAKAMLELLANKAFLPIANKYEYNGIMGNLMGIADGTIINGDKDIHTALKEFTSDINNNLKSQTQNGTDTQALKDEFNSAARKIEASGITLESYKGTPQRGHVSSIR